ncbi:chemotaxis protein CheA [uncultured Acetobacteroides sp.]|uniref:chemotaxis protein CheA n=1 Tax=uncultured Acetobacteroides sp. TaxID=1760811 RepID=UPI0029F48E03|nr:chemotaxis protein CheA [uncultured Acetobacteroides sp.]
MDQFRKKFFEEAFDLIQELEKSLLILEEDPSDSSHIEQVFRAMHTIKGNSAMFGFSHIDRFTHNLETVYDHVRQGKIAVSSSLLTVTLSAVDHLKALLNEGDLVSEETLLESKQITDRVNTFISGAEAAETTSGGASPAAEQDGRDGARTSSTYFISFKPHADIFRTGTNPLFLIDELCSMGKSIVYADTSSIPTLQELQADACYTAWSIFLATDEDENALRDVFIFVEDDCDLQIVPLAAYDLLGTSLFTDKIAAIYGAGSGFSAADLLGFVESLRQDKPAPSKKDHARRVAAAKDAAISSIRVSSDKVDGLMNLVSELVTVQARLSLFAENNLLPELTVISEEMDKISRRLRDTAFSICLIPLDSMLTRFHRLVRDVSTELGKDVAFVTEGTDTELDKTMIESLADPIMHILRNSLDHGIESAQDRLAKGKPAQGTIKLKAFYSGTNVHIQIADDGGGIDTERVREKAIQAGIISPDAMLSAQELLELIFLPGFSTAAKVTDLSGRGVGMDVVKRKITEIRGEVEIESAQGKGTTLTIKLPLTLSIIDGLLVQISDTYFVVPLSVVDTIFGIKHGELKKYNNQVVLAGRQIPYVYLRTVFDYPISVDEQEQVVLINYNDSSVGIVVDRVVGEYQAVLKPLGKTFKNLDIVSGASILGDGTIALVLDTAKIIKQVAAR